MRFSVTGASGFIGSHVVDELLATGHEVRALVHYNGRSEWGHLDRFKDQRPEQLEVRAGDVTDPQLTRDFLRDCDVVLHLAALIGIPYSYRAVRSYVSVNVAGTMNVLEASRELDIPRVVITSTSEVYGTARYTPIDEAHPLQAQSPYAASKIAADKLAEAYYRSFGLPVVTLRPFNTYGPRQSARAVVPTILSQLLAGSGVVELGNLAPRRDLTYVGDTARAFVAAATADGLEGETLHTGTGSAVSVGEIVELASRVVGVEATVVVSESRRRPATSEVDVLMCDPSKASEALDWRPLVGLEEGLRLTAEYVAAHLDDFRELADVV